MIGMLGFRALSFHTTPAYWNIPVLKEHWRINPFKCTIRTPYSQAVSSEVPRKHHFQKCPLTRISYLFPGIKSVEFPQNINNEEHSGYNNKEVSNQQKYSVPESITAVTFIMKVSVHMDNGAQPASIQYSATPEDLSRFKESKNIVMCFDGTHNKFGPAPYSNLLKFFRMLEKDSPHTQLCYYQPGIGAPMSVESESVFERYLSKSSILDNVDSMIAFSLDDHVIEAYKYLVRFYQNGDKIYMFGFSRGAFIARVLSSMIDKVGILQPGLEKLAQSTWSIYSAWEYSCQPSQPDYTTTLIDEYKKTFSRDLSPSVELLGLFDCVNSVGLLRDQLFPLSCKFENVKNLSHAVSIDERRGKYRQNLAFPHSYSPSMFSLASTTSSSVFSSPRTKNAQDTSRLSKSSSISSILFDHFGGVGDKAHKKLYDAKNLMEDIEQRLVETSKLTVKNRLSRIIKTQQVDLNSFLSSCDKRKFISGEFKELWFPGSHGDVGGGFASDVNGQFLSNTPLRWMFGEAIKKGVFFQKVLIRNFSQRYSSLDSILSCNHDMLSFSSGKLTHQISLSERETVLKLSKTLFNKSYIPVFRSCENMEDYSFKELLNNGVYLNSLKKLKYDFSGQYGTTDFANAENFGGSSYNEFHTDIQDIFCQYKEVPTEPIQGFDGHGNASILSVLAWWVIEFLPIGTKIEDPYGKWRNCYIPNLGRSRTLPEYANLHWSVYWRMQFCFDYYPKNLPEYVEKVLEARNGDQNVSDELMRILNTETSLQDDYTCELVKKLIYDTKKSLIEWDSQNWKKVPDDLDPILKEYNYI